MKRFACLTLIYFLFMTCMNYTAYAATETYSLQELGLQFSLPDSYTVITNDTPENDPAFSKLNTTKEAMKQKYLQFDVWLEAVSDETGEKINVLAVDSELDDFASLTYGNLREIIDERNQASSFLNRDYGLYQHSQTKFITTDMYFVTTCALQYDTVVNGKMISIQLSTQLENIQLDMQKEKLKTIVNSVKFKDLPQIASSGEIYLNTQSGMIFPIPGNWTPFSIMADDNGVVYIFNQDPQSMILHSCQDVWSQEENTSATRKAWDNSAYTKEEIAEIIGTTADKISTVQYHGLEFFTGQSDNGDLLAGADLRPVLKLIRIENGWMHTFQFKGDRTHERYPDFEGLLNAVEIVQMSDAAQSNNPYENAYDNLDVTINSSILDMPDIKDQIPTPTFYTIPNRNRSHIELSNKDIVLVVVICVGFWSAVILICVIWNRKKKEKEEYENFGKANGSAQTRKYQPDIDTEGKYVSQTEMTSKPSITKEQEKKILRKEKFIRIMFAVFSGIVACVVSAVIYQCTRAEWLTRIVLFVTFAGCFTTLVKVRLNMHLKEINEITTKIKSYNQQKAFRNHVTSSAGWRCTCQRIHPGYESSCVCGKTKREIQLSGEGKIYFCPQCSRMLPEDSGYCKACGARNIRK